jgi:hypothetical protein
MLDPVKTVGQSLGLAFTSLIVSQISLGVYRHVGQFLKTKKSSTKSCLIVTCSWVVHTPDPSDPETYFLAQNGRGEAQHKPVRWCAAIYGVPSQLKWQQAQGWQSTHLSSTSTYTSIYFPRASQIITKGLERNFLELYPTTDLLAMIQQSTHTDIYENKVPLYFKTTSWNRALLEKSRVTQLIKNSPHPPPFMEPQGSLSCSQESTTGPYAEPHESSPHLQTLFI